MSQTHEEIVNMVQQQWSRENRGRLFKNHVGQAYVGKKENDFFRHGKRIIQLKFASKIIYGLSKGSSDLIGWEYVTVDDYASVSIFCAIEVKTKAYPKFTTDQILWLNNVVSTGGKAYEAKENFNGYDLIPWEIREVEKKIIYVF
jgi:hypothetical protein